MKVLPVSSSFSFSPSVSNEIKNLQRITENFKTEFEIQRTKNLSEVHAQMELVLRRWSQVILSLGGMPLPNFTVKFTSVKSRKTYLITSTEVKVL